MNDSDSSSVEASRQRKKTIRGLGRTFQRGSVWWVAYPYRGKEHRESSQSTSEAAATKLLKKRLGEIGKGRLIGPIEEKVTFEQMAEDLTNDYRANAKRSIRSVKLSIKHLRGFFAMDRALDISTDRVRKYITCRQGEGASNASINRELAALKRMFSLAFQAGHLSTKPYVPTLEENNARQGFVEYGDFLKLRDNLPDHLKDPVTFLYLSGWRVSEMKALEWRDVDMAGKVVRLRPELSKNKDGRLLPLTGELVEVIERAREKRRVDCRFVFHIDGQPIGDFRKAWQTACVAAGGGHFIKEEGLVNESVNDQEIKLPRPRKRKRKKFVGLIVHDLRRTAVRNMVRAGIPERVSMALSGHKTRNVFDRYNIVSEADLAQAAEQLKSYLQKQTDTSVVQPMRKAV